MFFYQLYFDKNTLPFSAGLALLGLSGYFWSYASKKEQIIIIQNLNKQ